MRPAASTMPENCWSMPWNTMSSSVSRSTAPGGTGNGPPVNSGVSSCATMVSGNSVSEAISQLATGP